MIKREPGDLRQTITHRITQRFFVRWHMAAILVCVMLSGVVCSALLLHLGLRSMPWRYLLAVTGSYLIFFALIRLWLLYVSIAGSGRSVPGAGFGDLGNLGGGAPDWSSMREKAVATSFGLGERGRSPANSTLGRPLPAIASRLITAWIRRRKGDVWRKRTAPMPA